jgi:hypothetical protein
MRGKLDQLNKDIGVIKAVMLLNSIVLCVLLTWLMVKPTHAGGDTATATGGSASSTISIESDEPDAVSAAKKRGYFTAQEYADFHGINLDTVYRRIEASAIPEAEKVNSRWRLPCN